MSGTNDAPRASTSKEGAAEARFSVATTRASFNDPTHPSEIRRHVAATSAPVSNNDSGFFASSASGLARLQTYLPTGSWVTYTALETWAFSLRPNDPPTSPLSNCNAHQRIALLIVLVLSAALAFFSSFVKRFVYDAAHTHVVFPVPDYYNVVESSTDPVTGVEFPCRTRASRYCWPLVDAGGNFVYDETGRRLRVAVFRAGIPVVKRRKSAWWRSCFGPEADDDVPPAPYLNTLPPAPTTHTSPALSSTRALSIDAAIGSPPELIPQWTHTLFGSEGSAAYVDLCARVWGHACVSLLAFLALALCSTQVCGCLYPTLPDFLAPPLQTSVLALLAFVAAVAISDRAVGLGQQMVRFGGSGASQRAVDAQAEVPEHLRSVIETVVWVGRQDFSREKS